MKRKTVWTVLCFIALSLFLGACTKYTFMSTSKKVVGSWVYTDVFYKKDLFKKKQDLTDNYRNQTLKIFERGRLEVVNMENEVLKQGNWRIVQEIASYDEDGVPQYVDVLMIEYFLPGGRKDKHEWEISSLTGKRLDATEYLSGKGYYRYQLLRQE